MKAVKDIIKILQKTKGKAHICHVSHPKVAQCIKEAKKKGINITAETCVHYLLFTGDDLINRGAIFKCSPPLLSRKCLAHLRQLHCGWNIRLYLF